MNSTKDECFCYNDTIKNIIKIQSIIRRLNIKKLKDTFTIEMLVELIEMYNTLYLSYYTMNKKLKNKKLRLPNYPSEITENLVKFAIIKKYNVAPCWDTKKGDLSLYDIQIEVKGSCDLFNGGPSSYGPKEQWNIIYFVDAVDCINKNFKIYEIKLSNTHHIWKNIKVNKTTTFHQQCIQGRRPRITFVELKKQIPSQYIHTIFDGNINHL